MRRGVLTIGLVSALLFSCGGGGGGGSQGGGSGQIQLYLTDDMSVYPSILTTLYEVNLCSDNQCRQRVSLFSSQQGVEVDLAKLRGVLQYIGTANIPQGTYNRLELILDKNLKITDGSGSTHNAVFAPMEEKPNKPNIVQCPTNDRCYIRFNGAVNPLAMGKLIIDFDLKEFKVDTSKNPWQVTEVKVKPITPQEASGYKNKIYITVQSVNQQNNTITGQWMGRTYTVIVGSNTECEIDNTPTTNCIGQIQQGMCLEVKVQGDPATSTTLNAIEIEQENPKKCI